MEIKDFETFHKQRKAEWLLTSPACLWDEEGEAWCVQEYLSHCGEFTDADREYINRNPNLKELVAWIENDPDEPAGDSQ